MWLTARVCFGASSTPSGSALIALRASTDFGVERRQASEVQPGTLLRDRAPSESALRLRQRMSAAGELDRLVGHVEGVAPIVLENRAFHAASKTARRAAVIRARHRSNP
jgi:hypothetical protein